MPVALSNSLKGYLAAGECVAFVGAGFSAPCGMPGWTELLGRLLHAARDSAGDDAKLVELISACEAEVAAGRYMSASIGIRTVLGAQERSRLLSDTYSLKHFNGLPPTHRDRMLERMRSLVLAPWSGIITTNYDTLIESGIDQFCQGAAPRRVNGDQDSLGNILCVSATTPRFFVKLHGEAWADKPVLCSDDYVRAWQTSPRIRHFMTATMLRYRIVFIGCSIEDEIVRLRQGLWADFGRALPLCYALLPNTGQNRIRTKSLAEDAGIEVIPYDITGVSDGHTEVDTFLRLCAGIPQSDSIDGTLAPFRSMTTAEKLRQIGEINRALLRTVRGQPELRLEDKNLYCPLWESLDLGTEGARIRSCSEGERVYRVLFLTSVGLLRETSIGGRHFFEIPANVVERLTSIRL